MEPARRSIRARVVVATLVAIGAIGATSAGCDDLFHDTEWSTLCDRGGGACGAGAAATGGDTASPSAASASTSAGDGGGGGAAGAGGAACAPIEDCATPADDDCNGASNETCPATGYIYDSAPVAEYDDEPHNAATSANGDPVDGSGFDVYALGQLVDGEKGGASVFADMGNGAGYEWVLWTATATVVVTFDFGVPRDFTEIVIGINNAGFFVVQPSEVHLAFGDDGTTFTRPGPAYTLADGTLPAIMQGDRGDVALPVQASGRYVQITLVASGNGAGTAIDEVAFE